MSEPSEGFMDRHYFLLRRLHSLSGIVPIGAFLLFHLTTNASIMWGRVLAKAQHGDAGVETFQHEVNFIHNLPALQLVEWFVLFIPIAFHALLGIYYATTGKGNVKAYNYQDNWRYSLQRLSGYIGVLFIFMHVTSLRFGWTYGGLMPSFDGEHAASTTATHMQDGSLGALMALFYLVCVMALVFHFANGLWTAAITWGLTISVEAQKRWGYICAAIGLLLAGAGLAAVVGFMTLDIPRAQQIESAILRGHGGGAAAGDVIWAKPVQITDETPDH